MLGDFFDKDKGMESMESNATKYRKKMESQNGILSEQYDAYYNSETGDWLEAKCTDKNCCFCKDRPDKAPNAILTHKVEVSRKQQRPQNDLSANVN